MTLDLIFTDLASRGWLVNNLYQYASGEWRVNLRLPIEGGDFFTGWAEGSTLEEALEDCMSKLNDAEFSPDAPILASAAPRLSLAERLGLIPKPPTITRR